jgi:hypothetical protein
MTITPIQRHPIRMALKGQCVSCLQASNYLWNADGYALTDESTSEGFCNSCWNY